MKNYRPKNNSKEAVSQWLNERIFPQIAEVAQDLAITGMSEEVIQDLLVPKNGEAYEEAQKRINSCKHLVKARSWAKDNF